MDLSSTFSSVVHASRSLIHLKEDKIIQILHDLSRKAITHIPKILEENQKDLDRMPVVDPKYDRLKLTEERIHGISRDLINVSDLPSPVGRVLDERLLKNGLELTKLSVPLGVIGIIYESRPNVTFDVFSLCLKSRNACILKGGSDAAYSNKAIANLIQEVLVSHKVSPNIVALLPPEREATQALLGAVGFVDIIIPRGSQNLIDHVRANSKVPVIETGAGIVHTYFDESGDLKKGKKIINNAKTRRVSVCNALDCLVIHRKRLKDLPELTDELKKSNVEIFADAEALKTLKNHYPDQLLHEAQDEHYGTEFLSYKMSIKTVDQLDEALEHIHRYSSKHSEAIIAEDTDVIEKFLKSVDASSVYSNSSTAFTDGAQFGLGAEIGISTQKLHARGPMGLGELTSYKWIIRGDGQVRS